MCNFQGRIITDFPLTPTYWWCNNPTIPPSFKTFRVTHLWSWPKHPCSFRRLPAVRGQRWRRRRWFSTIRRWTNQPRSSARCSLPCRSGKLQMRKNKKRAKVWRTSTGTVLRENVGCRSFSWDQVIWTNALLTKIWQHSQRLENFSFAAKQFKHGDCAPRIPAPSAGQVYLRFQQRIFLFHELTITSPWKCQPDALCIIMTQIHKNRWIVQWEIFWARIKKKKKR